MKTAISNLETMLSPAITRARSDIIETELNQLVGRMVGDLGAVIGGALVVLGDRLGLYQGLARIGSANAGQLAEHTGLDERYVREWLAAQAAAGYVSYNAATAEFFITQNKSRCLPIPKAPRR